MPTGRPELAGIVVLLPAREHEHRLGVAGAGAVGLRHSVPLTAVGAAHLVTEGEREIHAEESSGPT